MRRSNDGYISATGMFKATFPYADAVEEETERKYIKSLPTTSTDETAGNVWIPPLHAIELAEEYGILPWITALLDNTPIGINPARNDTPKSISPPPVFTLPQSPLVPPTPTRGRTRRSASPSKIATPRKTNGSTRARKSASTRAAAKAESAKSESAGPTTPAAAKSTIAEETATQLAGEASAEAPEPTADAKEKVKGKPKVKPEEEPTAEENIGESAVRVNVDSNVEVKGDVETTRTHVEVEMPAGSLELPLREDPKAMIAKAKEMVEAAVNADETTATNSKKLKRSRQDLDEEDDEELPEETVPAKKAKTEAAELRKERIKTRALLGISATLALGYVKSSIFKARSTNGVSSAAVQYAFNAF